MTSAAQRYWYCPIRQSAEMHAAGLSVFECVFGDAGHGFQKQIGIVRKSHAPWRIQTLERSQECRADGVVPVGVQPRESA